MSAVKMTYQTITADPLLENDRQRIADFIERSAGIQMPPSKKTLIESRLRKRQRALSYNTLKEYVHFVFETEEGKLEVSHLVDALTTNKTEFYREQKHFEFLRTHLANHYQKGSICNVWSAGCSSGEEPYTLAIEMSEFRHMQSDFTFNVLATDISTKCLTTARRGVYSHDKIEPVDIALRKRYLLRSKDKAEDKVKIDPEIAKQVEFQYFNLISGDWHPMMERFSVIFCRNVMIYFNNQDRAELTRRFYQSLQPGGLLFIGHSESLIDGERLFTRLRPTVYRRNENL